MNILPPMMTVWHHCARKALGDNVDITVFDCSGKLDPSEFPGMGVQKYLNLYAATKCDEFIQSIARNRRTVWLCDDDVFFAGPKALEVMQREMAIDGTASVSFRPRHWWYFEIDGKQYEASASYCIAYNREMFWEKEHLSLAPRPGNTHPTRIGKGERRYDTGDWSNEVLLRKGYRCAIVPKDESDRCIVPFTGVSGAVMLLNYFKRPEQVMDYFLSPDPKAWSGNVLYGVLCAFLAVSTVQECYTLLKGHPYPLPSLPSKADLEKIRRERAPYLRQDQPLAWVDEVAENLKKIL